MPESIEEVEDQDTENTDAQEVVYNDYTCERCGFKFKKTFDYEPFLCYRCIRYIAKKTWTTVKTIQPVTSTTKKDEV